MLDLLFSTQDYIEDNIKFIKTMIEITENTKRNMLDGQAKILDLYTQIKGENLKKQIEEQQIQMYAELLETDKHIEELHNMLAGLEKMRDELS